MFWHNRVYLPNKTKQRGYFSHGNINTLSHHVICIYYILILIFTLKFIFIIVFLYYLQYDILYQFGNLVTNSSSFLTLSFPWGQKQSLKSRGHQSATYWTFNVAMFKSAPWDWVGNHADPDSWSKVPCLTHISVMCLGARPPDPQT